MGYSRYSSLSRLNSPSFVSYLSKSCLWLVPQRNNCLLLAFWLWLTGCYIRSSLENSVSAITKGHGSNTIQAVHLKPPLNGSRKEKPAGGRTKPRKKRWEKRHWCREDRSVWGVDSVGESWRRYEDCCGWSRRVRGYKDRRRRLLSLDFLRVKVVNWWRCCDNRKEIFSSKWRARWRTPYWRTRAGSCCLQWDNRWRTGLITRNDWRSNWNTSGDPLRWQ